MAQFAQLGNRRVQKRVARCCHLLRVGILGLMVAWALWATAPQAVVSYAHASMTGAVVINAQTGEVLYAQNAHTAMPMASTTKVLTAITALHCLPLDKQLTVAAQAEGVEGSSVYLRRGEKWTVRDLLYGLMLRSGNDAAVQLAIGAAGSVQAFVALMNQTALDAGAYRSHFCNPHGLHQPNHYTTAYDLACITAYAMRNQTFRQIVGCKQYRYTHCNGEERVFVNKNKMLWGYDGAVGVKTGYTKAAGRCLVSAAVRDGVLLVAVVLNEPNMWQRSVQLLDEGFAENRRRNAPDRVGLAQ